MKFTYDAYFGFLDGLRRRGYTIGGFEHLPEADEPYLLLRHDVDLDLGQAVELGRKESEAGVQSSYFVLLSSPFYNPASAEGRAALAELRAGGHRIGLHFDPTVHRVDDVDGFRDACRREVSQLAELVGDDVTAVSFHRPAPHLVGAGPDLTAPLPHSYLPEVVERIEYCTDSTGRWRYGPPDEREAVRRGGALHLVTHPIWWGDDDVSAEARLGRFLAGKSDRMRAAVAAELAVTPLTTTGGD